MSTKPFKLIILIVSTFMGGVAGEDGIHKLKYGEDVKEKYSKKYNDRKN